MDFTHDEKVKDKFNRMWSLLLRAQKAYERNNIFELHRLLGRIKDTYSWKNIVRPGNILQINIKTYSELTNEDIVALDILNDHLQALEQKCAKKLKTRLNTLYTG